MYESSERQELFATKHQHQDMIVSIIYITAASIISLYMLIASRQHSRKEKISSTRDIYIKQIASLLLNDRPSCRNIRARSRQSRLALAEAIYIVVSHTYGNDREKLRHIVEQNNLEPFLLRRIRLSRGVKRAHLLMLLSAIPIHQHNSTQIERYIHSSDKEVRISALTATLSATPAMAIRTISELDFDLSPFDTARIISLLRRGLLPIAYEPLLASSNRNLRTLGLAIVRSFGIEIAEKRLHKIISNEEDISIVRETIYTLASLGRPLGHTKIRERLAAMPAVKRKELCRHLTVEGYSISAVRSLFTEGETLYAETLINSYKRALVRPTTTF